MSTRHILFLRGVFLSDIGTEYLVDEDDNEEFDISDEIIVQFDKIPTKYKKSSWMKYTNLKCWWCDLTHQHSPYFIPLGMTRENDECVMSVLGSFCSIHCAIAYNQSILKNHDWERSELLRLLYIDFTNKDLAIPIKESPPKTIMIQYGGDKTIEEYKKIITDLDRINIMFSVSSILL